MAEKLSTQEILARARAQAKQQAGDEPSTPAQASAGEENATDAAAAESSGASKPASTPSAESPKSTKDILAAARAQAAAKSQESSASSESEAASKPSNAATPKSTKDILAAARAQASKPAVAAGGEEPTPSSTKDILAAARAQAGKPAAAGSSKPAAKKTAAEAAGAKPAAGELPPVPEMVRAAREGKRSGTPTAEQPARPSAPVIPTRPTPVKKAAKPAGETRRNALVALVATPFALAWTLLTIATGTFTLALARFMMPNVLVEPPTRFKIGPPSDYPFGSVSTKWKAQFGIWIVHTVYKGKSMIYALSTVCTHLGCTPNWLEGEQKFKCPCHGSGFYINGINFEGPAPRPLERVGIALAPDGALEVDKSVKFQEELGQWADSTSYVDSPVA
jgi:cytochrome b6-f complex iron-sulfur subunit